MVAKAELAQTKSHPRSLDIRQISILRTMYLVQGLQPSEIEAAGVGFTANQVSQLANREGWTKLRRNALQKGKESAQASVDSAVSAVAEAIAIESEELCFKALNQTRAGLDKGGLDGAKQAQAASSTLRNLNSVAQAIRKPAESGDPAASTNLNLFFIASPSVPAVKPGEKTVAPIETELAAEVQF